MKNVPQMAESLDVSAITDSPPRGAGDRLGRILEETKPKWMGRRRAIPGDPPRIERFRADLQQIRALLVAAVETVDRVSAEINNDRRVSGVAHEFQPRPSPSSET